MSQSVITSLFRVCCLGQGWSGHKAADTIPLCYQMEQCLAVLSPLHEEHAPSLAVPHDSYSLDMRSKQTAEAHSL